MDKLYAFLHPLRTNQEKEVIISDRFQDENGNVIPFRIRALTQEESDEITKKSRRGQKVNGVYQERLDPVEFNRRMVVAATVEPAFNDKALCEAYGVMDPLLVPGKMLLSGEYTALLDAISKLSGFDKDAVVDEAKN